MDLKEIGMNIKTWVYLAQDRGYWSALVSVALNLWVPKAMELVKSLFLFPVGILLCNATLSTGLLGVRVSSVS